MSNDPIGRARELQSLAVKRDLTESEIQEAYGLVESLSKDGQLHGVAWAHDAIRRTYKRRKKAGTYHLATRSIERTTADILKRAGNRIRMDMNCAPKEQVIEEKGKKR